MNEIQLDKLTKASIDLAQAANDYGALKVIFGVFMVVVLVMFVSFLVWLWMLQRRLGIIEEFCKSASQFFSDLNDHTIGKEEAKMVIEESLDRSEAMVKYYILKIRLENHLDNKDATKAKIYNVVENDSMNRKIFLSRYICKGHSVNFAAVQADKDALIKLMTEWVYRRQEEFTVSLMANAVTIYFEKLRLSATGKIDDITD